MRLIYNGRLVACRLYICWVLYNSAFTLPFRNIFCYEFVNLVLQNMLKFKKISIICFLGFLKPSKCLSVSFCPELRYISCKNARSLKISWNKPLPGRPLTVNTKLHNAKMLITPCKKLNILIPRAEERKLSNILSITWWKKTSKITENKCRQACMTRVLSAVKLN
jgi:hypothetical protein